MVIDPHSPDLRRLSILSFSLEPLEQGSRTAQGMASGAMREFLMPCRLV
jgi:hypothetical protein